MKTKVLVVEDNEMIHEILTERLKLRDFEVFSAKDGVKAVDMALQEEPDIILMDISLPVLNGLEATKKIRAQETNSRTPIIALTAHALDEDRKRSLEAGCDDFETKPINFDQLMVKIEGLLSTE